MIKRIMFAYVLAAVLCVSVSARLSPAIDIIERKLGENRTVSADNTSPVAADMLIETQSGIAVFKSFPAIDEDGDELEIVVVDYPDNGGVKITGDGQFMYSPLSGYSGKDSFSYRAVDAFGNKSAEKLVEIKVTRPAADIYFDDMKNHWAHNSAIKMAATGLMTGERVDGKLLFNPESDMTRGDFLALTLIMAGHEEDIPFSSRTVFADDSTIPQNIKSYVQYAYDKGIVSGYDNGDGTINFESAGAVSRAEAAVLTSKILGLSAWEDSVPSYKDASDIPAWASSAVSSLYTEGLMGGDALGAFSAEKKLTRAEGAEMICNVADYVADKEKAKRDEGKKKTIFNLFGLLG